MPSKLGVAGSSAAARDPFEGPPHAYNLARTMRYMLAWAVSVALIAGCHAQTGRTLVRHEFNSSAQGWIVSGDTRPADAIFTQTGGQPGGCITGVDEALGETWYFSRPRKCCAIAESHQRNPQLQPQTIRTDDQLVRR